MNINFSFIILSFAILSFVSCKKDYSNIHGEWVVKEYIIDHDTVFIDNPIFKLNLDTTNTYIYNGPKNYSTSGKFIILNDHINLVDEISQNEMQFYIQEFQKDSLVLLMDKNGLKQTMIFGK